MLKGLFYTAISLTGLLLVTQPSFAIPFSDTRDFSSTQGSKSYPYLEVRDDYEYFHTLNIVNSNLDDATLTLRHLGNDNTNTVHPTELWYSGSLGNHLIGKLSTSINNDKLVEDTDWVTDTWSLSSDVLSEINTPDPWILWVKLYEGTNGDDKLLIDYSTLSGNYSLLINNSPPPPPPTDDPPPPLPPQNTSIPEPSTILLLGSALTGLGLLRKFGK